MCVNCSKLTVVSHKSATASSQQLENMHTSGRKGYVVGDEEEIETRVMHFLLLTFPV